MSQTDLAKSLDLTRAAVSAWVGGRAEPREDTKRAIAAVLGTDVESIYRRTDVVTPRGWFHRAAHADGGREYGNPAVFAFDADLAVLTREATQNSLDERLDRGKPVRVRYTLDELTGEHLARFLRAVQWQELQAHYDSASSAEQKVARSLRSALEALQSEKRLRLLRIDDYNAAGLTGPEYGDGRFSAVVRRLLDSHKSDRRAGGSYGLGKATLWATSGLGLVLINTTLSEPHEGRTHRRVVGRLDLPWRVVDGREYAGPAWFGERDVEQGREQVSRSWWADEETVRELHLERVTDEPGTSFLIVGAHDASGDADDLFEMHEKLVRALADEFWGAMVGGRMAGPLLEASVVTMRNGQVVVAEERVDPHVRHPAVSRALQAYLDGDVVDAFTSDGQVVCVEVPLTVPARRAQGRKPAAVEHRAVLLLTAAGPDDERVGRIECMRGTRMTVFERRPRELPMGALPFRAVLLAGSATARGGEDVQLAEEFLRASEPPEHNKWDRTEELSGEYVRGAAVRLREFFAEVDRAVRGVVGRKETSSQQGPDVLRELLRLDAVGGRAARPGQAVPVVAGVVAHVEDTGAWRVTTKLKLPDAEDPWVLTPVAKFDVRSGGRPTVAWSLLVATENCRVEEGSLVIDAGVRSASFTGVTDPATHPVRGGYSRLVVDLQRARGGAE
jgi:DNA-binding XRE family transcriptional regulator